MRILLFIFFFINLYGPLSTNISFAFNVLLFCHVFMKRPHLVKEGVFITIPLILLIISIFAFISSRDPASDTSSFGIYIRMVVNCLVFPSIIAFFYRKRVRFLSILSFTLVLHCLMVLVQMAFPQLQELNGVLFRFEREDIDMADYSLRRLGLTGGFDQSALFAVLSCLFAIALYIQTKKICYLIFLMISLVASLFTSRTGMVASVIVLLMVAIGNRKQFKIKINFSTLFLTTIVIIAITYFILPVVLNSIGISYGKAVVDTEMQYSSKTSDYLFEYHLLPLLSLNNKELLFGYGCEVNKSALLPFGSDIGYVKQIFQVGVVGVFFILVFCLLMARRTSSRYSRFKYDAIMKISSQIMWILLPLYVIFNYKNHIMYTVCYFEVFLFVYYYSYCHYIYHTEYEKY